LEIREIIESMPLNSRSLAAELITTLLQDHRSLKELLQQRSLLLLPDKRDRALVKEICFGVCRYYYLLVALLEKLIKKPIKDKTIYSLALIGIYQLSMLRIPAHAVVAETVNAARQLKKSWATGFINGILRSYLRQKELITTLDEITNTAHPSWLIASIQYDWPTAWLNILQNNNQHAALCLRVNQRKMARNEYLALLTKQGVTVECGQVSEQAIRVTEQCEVNDLPGFAEGFCSVQDEAAQLAASLLFLQPKQRVLDACAAPGGKTCHMLELVNELTVIALDNNPTRRDKITSNCARLNLSATVLVGDATELTWWDQQLFDRILVDAPCSATGVIRRQPDIKLLRKETDIERLAHQQINMLTNLWPTLKVGGLLLYATCSILHAENTSVIHQFLAQTPTAFERKIIADWGVPLIHGRQILPGMAEMDGFYYCKIQKN